MYSNPCTFLFGEYYSRIIREIAVLTRSYLYISLDAWGRFTPAQTTHNVRIEQIRLFTHLLSQF